MQAVIDFKFGRFAADNSWTEVCTGGFNGVLSPDAARANRAAEPNASP